MRKPQGPCQNCSDRTVEDPEQGTKDCHATCDRYRDFRSQLDEWKKQIERRIGDDMVARNRPWMNPRKFAAAKRRERNEKNHKG